MQFFSQNTLGYCGLGLYGNSEKSALLDTHLCALLKQPPQMRGLLAVSIYTASHFIFMARLPGQTLTIMLLKYKILICSMLSFGRRVILIFYSIMTGKQYKKYIWCTCICFDDLFCLNIQITYKYIPWVLLSADSNFDTLTFISRSSATNRNFTTIK